MTGEQGYLDRTKYFIALQGGKNGRMAWKQTHSDRIGDHKFDSGALIPDELEGCWKTSLPT
ncbi:hypothetical protein [Halococcus sp. IIIV-5B]|uniref:hypothetical protein n=1 Tax=Halococcus sp. IIIV-5B TaxID=2321230 RepID=UPI0011C415F7|nr:hypothetical protein [Halococcus sp. IIIV-5B]